jgi:hypothetical protein
MNAGQTVFSQLMDHLPSYEFQKCVERYRGDANHRGFSCRDEYLAMAFAQLTYRESLRDIEACLGSMRGEDLRLSARAESSTYHFNPANRGSRARMVSCILALAKETLA